MYIVRFLILFFLSSFGISSTAEDTDREAAVTNALDIISSNSLTPIADKLCEQEIRKMLASGYTSVTNGTCFDRNSSFVLEGDKKPSTRSEPGGVLMYLHGRTDGKVVIVDLPPTSNAHSAGISAGDVIVSLGNSVSTQQTVNFPEEVQKILTGDAGSIVYITYKRGVKTHHTSVVRKENLIPYVWSQEHTDRDGNPVLHVVIRGFVNITPRGIWVLMDSYDWNGNERQVVLDVRDNPGGPILSVTASLCPFVPSSEHIIMAMRRRRGVETYRAHYDSSSGCIVDRRTPDGAVKRFPDEHGYTLHLKHIRPGLFSKYKIVVLANRGTASAGEIFARVLQKLGRHVIGVHTYRKGTTQVKYRLPGGGTLKYTVGEVYIGGDALNGVGVRPNITVRDGNKGSTSDLQLEEAIRTLQR